MSPSTRRAWIEIKAHPTKPAAALSPSTRRAWIEIQKYFYVLKLFFVALHPEGVDRNSFVQQYRRRMRVALHPEGVDRNHEALIFIPRKNIVALHPEGVDRNIAS